MMSHDKIEMLYFDFHKTLKHQTWHRDDVGWGAPIHKLETYISFHKAYYKQICQSDD